MDEVEHYTVNDRYEVKIFIDPDPESPREWDNIGTIATWHRRYSLGDEQPNLDPEEFKEQVLNKPGVAWLPVYMYDHSGLCLRTTPFSCQWDSGQLGFIYVDMNESKEFETEEEYLRFLKLEIEMYSQFIEGDVYGYTLEEKGEELHSCWGFYGMNHLKSDIKGHLVYFEQKRRGELNDN